MTKQSDGFQRSKSKRNITLFLFTLPALIVYTVFFVLPILGDIYISLLEWNGGLIDVKFVGLKNYIKMFTEDKAFYAALLHNVMYTAFVVTIQLSMALLFALILFRNIRGHNFFKTVYLLPVVLSSVTLALIWSYMYDPLQGFVNYFLKSIGLGSFQQNWLGDKKIALFSVGLINAWQYIGYSMIIFIAGLLTIPESLYEAAEIDGAGMFSKFANVTFPLLAPATTMNIVLSTTGSFKVFELIYVITPPGGPISDATEVLATLMYKVGFTYGEMGYSAAISIILLIVIMIIGFVQLKLLRSREVKY